MGKCCIEITSKMEVCEVNDLVLEKITSSILNSNEFGIEKWIVIIFLALLPVLINILYKRVNSRYYNIDEKYFNFLSLKRVLVYIFVFSLVILIFAYLFYGAIIDFSLGDTAFYLCLLSLLCIAAAICIYNIKFNFNFNLIFECLKDNKIINFISKSIVLIIIIVLYKYFKFKSTSVKYLILFVVAICICVLCHTIKRNKHCKCKSLTKYYYIIINSISLFALSLLSVSLLSCLIFSDRINENLYNSVEKNSKINQNQHQDISEENKKNNNATTEYLKYVLSNSGDLKAKEFVMLFKNPKDYIDYEIDVKKSRLQQKQLEQKQLEQEKLEQEKLEQEKLEQEKLEQNLNSFFKSAENANINKELFATMRLLIILNLLLEPFIFIFALLPIFILIGALLLLLRTRFFKPNKIKTYEYIDKPGLMKEVVITEYKDKLLVMEGLIYNNNLYLDRTNYRIIDLSDKLKFAREKFDSVIFDKLDFLISVIIIDNCGKESKHSVDISFNKMKETLRLKIYDNNFSLNEIEISCNVSFKNNCMIIKSEIKQILETNYGMNNFKFKMDESAKKNFSIDENTGEITINLDLK